MTTKEQRREKRYRLIVEAIQRWQKKLAKAESMIKRSHKMLDKLMRARIRAEKQMKTETQVESSISEAIGLAIERDISPKEFVAIAEKVADDLDSTPTAALDDIPGFLYRGPSDGAVAAELKAQLDDKKREKARVRIEHMKAKRSGETRKMPLTGRAALDALK